MIKILSKKCLKIVLLIFFLISLSFAFLLFYNNQKGALAQDTKSSVLEEEPWQVPTCEKEIPVGFLTDEALATFKKLAENYEKIITKSAGIVALANQLAEIPDQCRAENCQTSCHLECAERDPDTGDCLHWECIKPPCTCTNPNPEICPCSDCACPDYDTIVAAIDSAVAEIDTAYQEIENLFTENNCKVPFSWSNPYDYSDPSDSRNVTRLEFIKYLLEASRRELARCVTASEFLIGEETEVGVKEALTCQETFYQDLLPQNEDVICDDLGGCQAKWWENMKKCCYRNNFVCCEVGG